MLPVVAAAVAGVAVAGNAMFDRGGADEVGVATGPALTTQVGAATTNGVPQLLDQISLAAADVSHPDVKPGQYIYIDSKTADTFVKTVETRAAWPATSCTVGRCGCPRAAPRAG